MPLKMIKFFLFTADLELYEIIIINAICKQSKLMKVHNQTFFLI